MLELISRKSSTGDISVNLAEHYLARQEWGRARMALLRGLEKGGLTRPARAHELMLAIETQLSCEKYGEHSSTRINVNISTAKPG